MQKQLYYILDPEQADYMAGEAEGRKDGARRYGKADVRFTSEAYAMGYRDGYASTFCL